MGAAFLYLHKSINVDVILQYVSVENQIAPGQIGISPLTKTLRRIMQHSPVRSIIIWSWEDHLASGLIEVTYPPLYLINNLLNIFLEKEY